MRVMALFLALVGQTPVHVDVKAVQAGGQPKDGASDRHLILPRVNLKQAENLATQAGTAAHRLILLGPYLYNITGIGLQCFQTQLIIKIIIIRQLTQSPHHFPWVKTL